MYFPPLTHNFPQLCFIKPIHLRVIYLYSKNLKMKKIIIISIYVLLTILIFRIGLLNIHAQEPRLFFTQQRIEQLKAAKEVPKSHHALLYNLIKNRVESNDLSLYGSDVNNNYIRSYKAVESALIYLLTDDAKYAQYAYDLLLEMYTSGDEGTPEIPDLGEFKKRNGSKTLRYAFPSMAYGICYDWVRSAWTDEQTNTVKNKILAGLEDWKNIFRWELYDMPQSNWVSVCRGAELVMLLGVQEEENRVQRYDTLKYLLKKHYDMAYGNSGYSNEGIGYVHYGVPFGLAAWQAAQSIGDKSLDETFSRIQFHKLLMYAFSYTESRMHLMTSVDSKYSKGEGLFGLVMADLPEEELRIYKSFYDNHIGIESVSNEGDTKRLGAVWNFIFYPENIDKVNPNAVLPPVFADEEYGAWFFRNQWKNKNDILFNIMGKCMYHNKGWQDAETFNIGLIAFDNRFFGGPGKAHEDQDYSSILVDRKARESAKDIGMFQYYEGQENGAYLIIDGGTKYTGLSLSSAKRHALVSFDENSSALIALLDILKSNGKHNYRWQLNVGNEEGNAGISVETGTEANRPYFILYGKNNAYLKGWSLATQTLNYQGTDPLFIETNEVKDADFLTVMKVGTGTPPTAFFTQSGLSTIMELESKYVFFDKSKGQIVHQAEVPVNINPEIITGSNSSVALYPNPATDFFYLKAPASHDNSFVIQISDIQGNVLQTNSVSRNEAFALQHTIHIKSLPLGVYFVTIRNNSKIQVMKLIKK